MVYFAPQKNILGKLKKEMKKKFEDYECFEYSLLLKTYESIRATMI